jgi:hypothetical protein
LKLISRHIFTSLLLKLAILLSLLFHFISFDSIAQNRASTYKTITASFAFEEVNFTDIAVLTNVLKIKNNNGKTYTFSISLNIPEGWKSLNNEEKVYKLNPNDSIYVPVRLTTTNKKTKGGTKYNISAYINTNEGKQMAYARFLAGRPKITNWQMQILPRPRLYFLNGENSTNFQIHLSNDGDENQEVLVSMQKIGDGFIIKDTLDKIIKRNYFELNLAPYSDSTIPFHVNVLETQRNQSRLDVWGYRPNIPAVEKRYSLFIRASEVRLEKGGMKKSKKVDFVKLANSIDFVKLNNSAIAGNGTNTIPLTMFTSINNILGNQPIINTNFQGFSQIGRKNSISYQIQTSLIYYKFSDEFYSNRLAANFSYFFQKGYAGLITTSTAKTILGGYNFNQNSNISGFYSREKFFGQNNLNTVGLNFGTRIKFVNLRFGGFLARDNRFVNILRYGGNFAINFIMPKIVNVFLFANYRYFPLNLSNLQISRNYGIGINKKIKRYFFNINYRTNFNERITNSNSNVLSFQTLSLIQSFTLKNRRTLFLNTLYSIRNSTSLLPSDSVSYSITNFINFAPKPSKKNIRITANYFIGFNNVLLNKVLTFGPQFNVTKTKSDKDVFIGGTIRPGYSTILNKRILGYVFNMQSNVFARYKVWNVLFMYNYGPSTEIERINVLNESPSIVTQMIRVNLGHQYQFKNIHFIFENNLNYMYMNLFKRNNFGLFTQLFYYTNNNYRFSLFANLALNSSSKVNYRNFGSNVTPVLAGGDEKSVSQSANFGITIKKDFAIPIPKRFRNNKFCDSKFVVFFDVNGNNKMEEGEVPVENVVLRMNDFEVITDEKGSASFINISFAKYRLQVFPLIDVGSWFPNVPDSMEVCGPEPIYIPFTKGVQVYGLVELDREEYAGQLFEKLDISRFKLFLIDSTGRTHTSVTDNKGNFNFYVPYAKYTLKFDENALGTNFYLAENDIELHLSSGIESYYHHFLIIEKKRKVKKKIFGPDGKITYVEEQASGKGSKDKKSGDEKDDLILSTDSLNQIDNNLNNNGKDGKDGQFNIQVKETKLDSLIKLLNELLKKVATKPDVRTIVKQEIQLLRDELNATFTIQIEEFPKGKRPTGVLLQLIRMKKVEELKLPDGKIVYYSGDYKTVQEAEKFCKDFQTSGFRNAKVANRKTLLSTKK